MLRWLITKLRIRPYKHTHGHEGYKHWYKSVRGKTYLQCQCGQRITPGRVN